MKRFLSLTLAFVMVFSILAGSVTTALAAVTGTAWDNALHFFVRHWHTVDENGSASTEDNYGTYAHPVEGWIVPDGDGFRFYDDMKTPLATSKYIVDMDTETGAVTLAVNPREVDGEPAENFVGFSVSAGQRAVVASSEENKLIIRYRDDVALVKSHIFYQEVPERVFGSSRASVFPWQPDSDADNPVAENQEQDTARIYVNADTNAPLYKTEADGKESPIKEGDPLPPGVKAKLTKVYSTLKGLHTDKTAKVNEDYSELFGDDRTFDIDLEAWYAIGHSIDVALMLDASGSMAFTMENLEPMKVNFNELKALDQDLAIKMESKKVYAGDQLTASEDWESRFLSTDEVNLLLNKHKTDTSLLSFSGYTYYVFDPNPSTMEFVPLGYWDGTNMTANYPLYNEGGPSSGALEEDRDWFLNTITKKRDAYLIDRFNYNEYGTFEQHWIADNAKHWGSEPIKMNASYGFALRSTKEFDNDPKKNNTSLGFKILDPESKTFTLSFSIMKTDIKTETADYTDQQDNASQNQAEILYIGPNTIPSDEGFIRLIRDSGSNRNRLKAFAGWSMDNPLININNVFSTNNAVQYVTIVFSENDDGTVHMKTYINGQCTDTDTFENDVSFTLEDDEKLNIVFNGIREKDGLYNGAELYIDNIQLYNVALSDIEVATIYDKSLDLGLLDDMNLIFDMDSNVLGTINSKNYFNNGLGEAGWYYINPSSNIYNDYLNKFVQTSKIFVGLTKEPAADTNKPIVVDNSIVNPDIKKGEDKAGGGSYTISSNSSVKFFIDQNNNLRCFFQSGARQDRSFVSYVYENSDNSYIKAEALRRALGAFTVTLNTLSPSSEISAVRFSTQNIKDEDLDKLVLLDWTNDLTESVGMLSLNRGDGGTLIGDPSSREGKVDFDPPHQYNYGMTGGTYTRTGFAAFNKYLFEKETNKDSQKYLIIFTDGKDNEYDKYKDKLTEHPAIQWADTLKDEGYIIYTVMLNAGSISPYVNPGDFAQAKNFLTYMSGTKQSSEIAADQNLWNQVAKDYVKITNDETDDDDNGGFTNSAIDTLVNIFTTQIAPEISLNLRDYSVRDTIDPRFDLVDAYGHIWHLDANGVVTVKDTNGAPLDDPYYLSENETVSIRVNNATDVDARTHTPALGYDSKSQLYYLEWTKQTIPGSELHLDEPTSELSIWNARFTIRAKEDFIGGNAVLTNGQDEMMNYVFLPTEPLISSGTDRATELNPSKGFPRTVVNVQMPTPKGEASQVIYMGESLDQKETLEQMIAAAIEGTEDHEKSRWYWQYLQRYQAIDSEIYDKLLDADSNGITIPYYYLPSTLPDYLNNTGVVAHRKDVLGELTYKWTIDRTDGNDPTEDTNPRKITLSVEYRLYAINEASKKTGELTNEYRESLLNGDDGLIGEIAKTIETDATDETDDPGDPGDPGDLDDLDEPDEPDEPDATPAESKVYLWDQAYKPEVGSAHEQNGTYTYVTNIISGEIALEMVVPRSTAAALQVTLPGETITYTAVLKRSYNGTVDTVGTYTLEYEVPTTPPMSDVYLTLRRDQIEFEEDYEYAKTYGLPIGTYTLEPVTPSAKEYSFSPLTAVSLTNMQQAFFPLYPRQYGEPGAGLSTFAAPYDEDTVQPLLGTDEETMTYTDERYALLQVTLYADQGGLTVSKTVTGNDAEKDREFHFTVTLSDQTLSGAFGDMTFVNGIATFTLKHGERKSSIGLPVGTTYTVTELEANEDNYTTTATQDMGTIKSGGTTVLFVNARDTVEVPQTGDNSNLGLWIALLLVSGAGIALVLALSKKRFGHR